jgi:hypothetical protein
MFEIAHLFVLSQPEFVARKVSGALSDRGRGARGLRMPFFRRARGG